MKKIYLFVSMILIAGISFGQQTGGVFDDGTPPDQYTDLNIPSPAGLRSPTVLPNFYNYDTEGNGGNSFPWNISGGKEVQVLYLAGDFNQPASAPAGTITALAFRLRTGAPIGPWTYTDLTIKMGQSTITALPTGGFYTGALTTVYYNASVSLTGAAGDWMFITLDTPFVYDPTLSLIVDVGQCGVPGATGYSSCYTNTPGSGRRNYSVGGCPFVYLGVSTYTYNLGFNMITALPPTVVTNAAGSITATGATLNGTVNANGSATTVTFQYGLTTTYGATVTALQSPVSGNTSTPVTANITGLIPNTLYHFRAVGTNEGGTTNGNDMTFTTALAPPLVVTNAANPIGLTTATLNGTVTAQNSPTTVTFQWGPTIAFGNVANATPGTVSGNTATPVTANLSGLTTNTTYYYRCVGVNAAGTTNGATQSFVAGCPQIPPAGPPTGPVNVCANSTGVTYSIAPLANATGYTWSVPPGASITAGGNTPSITVNFGNTSGNVSVYGTSICYQGLPGTSAVTVHQLPVPTITGSSNECVNLGSSYGTEAGFTNYAWTVSSGGTITGGTGTHQVDITWNTAGAQSVMVNYTDNNGCTALTPTGFPVTVEPLPSTAGNITGTSNVCKGSTGVTYSVTPISNAVSYVWLLPPGATITYGMWTNAITVDFSANATSGNISVYGNNLCGNGPASPSFPVTIVDIPGGAGAITGSSFVCTGSTGVAYSVAPVSGATGYTWSLPAGATIVSGANTANILVDFADNALSGIITVAGTTICGTGTISPAFNVTVLPEPVPPVITIDGYTLSSNYAEGNQWYYNGAIITGATGQSLDAAYNGWYWDVVSVDDCESDTSNNIYVVITGIDDPLQTAFRIYPVPNDGRFTVSLTTPTAQTLTMEVHNSLGVRIYDTRVTPVNGTIEQVVDLRPVPNGIYTIVLRTDDNRVVRRFLVNK